MAFNTDELGVIRTYVAITGDAPTQAELQAAFDKTGLNALATDLITDQAATGNTPFVQGLYQNLLGRAADTEGLQYWTSLLSSSAGVNQLSKARLAVEFQNAAALNAADEEDFVDGTAGLSPVSGEFAEPDDGEDTTDPVEITTEFNFDTTKGASDVKGWTHEKSEEDGTLPSEDDGAGTYMSNTHKIYNVGMEAIDEGVGTISRDYTFRTENQLGDHGHYESYFLSPVLDNVTTNLGSVLTVEVIDRIAEANNKEASMSLLGIEAFSFRLNGEEVVVGSQDILNAETYEALAAAIEARIEELAEGNADLNSVTVELGADFTRQQVDADTLATTGANVLGTQILITATGNNLIERGGFTFGEKSGVDRNVDSSGRQDTSVLGSESDFVTTNLEFKNVGYGSQGGSVNVSGQSMSDRGVEQFDIVAEKHNLDLGVWLTELSSQPLKNRALNTLEVINLTGNASYFHVGNEQNSANVVDGGTVKAGKADAGITDVRVFNAAQFGQNVRINAEVTENVYDRGDLDLRDDAGNPTKDNAVFSYNLGNGDNQLYLSFSQKVIAHEDAVLSISTGSGSDEVHLVLDNDAAAPSNWLENQQDLKNIVISTGSGDDLIWTEGEGDVTILAGAGNDVIYTDNSGAQTVVNSGGDFVDVNAHWVFNGTVAAENVFNINGKALTTTLLAKSTVTVTLAPVDDDDASAITDTAALALENGFESEVDLELPAGVFYGDQRHINQAVKDAINNHDVLKNLLVAEDGPDNTLIVRSLIDGTFEGDDLRIDLTAGTAGQFSESELSALWDTYRDSQGDSTITDDAASNTIFGNPVSGLNDSDSVLGFTPGYTNSGAGAALAKDNATTDVAGSAADAGAVASTNNIIDAGSGDDVIVLSTNDESKEILVFNGVFGNDTIVNFDEGSGTADSDVLNFESYLQTKESNSGSASSEVLIARTVNTDSTANANEISILSFDQLTTSDTWEGFGVSQLLSAINDGGTDYGNLTSGSLDAANDNSGSAFDDYVGNKLDHLVLVENSANEGEYKVFKLTSTIVDVAGDAGEFDTSGAQLVGSIDLGDSITNFADTLGAGGIFA